MNYVTLCPKCHLPIEEPILEGTPYVCKVCGWSGVEVLGTFSATDSALTEAAAKEFSKEFLSTFAKECALPLGRVLAKYELVTGTNGGLDPNKIARCLRAMAAYALQGVVCELREISHDAVD